MITGSMMKSKKKMINSEKNENENNMFQNLWDLVKCILRGKFMVTPVYLNK